MGIRIKFCGAAGTVTGSKHLLRLDSGDVLLDCGLFQGHGDLRARNWRPPPFDAADLKAVVLSHAHIDHTGYLPRLLASGFKGPIHCTPSTADLCNIMLPDSAHLQEEEAAFANRSGYSKHKPALPLYTQADAQAVLQRLVQQRYGAPFEILPHVQVQYQPAGHILGAASIQVLAHKPAQRRIVFSGDLGRPKRPILHDPEPVTEADVLLLESTYGDQFHAPHPEEQLARIVNQTVERHGALVIPAFAIGKTQELIWLLRRLEEEKKIPIVPVYVDSPMAASAIDVYCRHPEDHDLEMTQLSRHETCPLATHRFHVVQSVEESKAINHVQGPVIIISASGMITGGRILHHLKNRLGDRRNTVLLVGYQADGTRGRALQDGATALKIHGELWPVVANVAKIDGLSGHADQGEIISWLRRFKRAPQQVYLVHGEPKAADQLARVIRESLGWSVRPARDGEEINV